ncbi:CNNM domain-containing protein [Pelagerythrobacter rhizovicinus]|uniref:HlyC/CorC family transporter n=1 Tax=Pelagerythrobacter rhizovicinus TaxID=2268576 RepID=A0A4V1QW23_9SPHN|nr:hemolysin family protein [Pelagerythrobacter rhizovicinus]RXZ64656.1 HlyC/CorC family transporter [Pelagerythrobacter rhizovicinus]
MTLLIFYVTLALVVSFLCSLLEASLLTITPSGIRSAEERGAPWARKLRKLKDDVERPLAAILTLNTVAHTMGAAGAGAQYAKIYGAGSEAVFAAILTVAVLVVTEIIPKTIGARYASSLAPFTAWLLPILIAALMPLVWASRQVTRLITLGKPADLPRHREELLALASLGQTSGQIDDSEVRFMKNMLQLHAVKTMDVMTPRTVVFSLPLQVTPREFAQQIKDVPYTRIPVFDGQPDNIRGFIIRHELLGQAWNERSEVDLEQLVRPLPSVLDALPVDKLFHRMIAEHHHVMAVVDEYGTFLGLVTLEDVLETIFGFEIVDELDEVPDLQEYARELSRRRASGVRR